MYLHANYATARLFSRYTFPKAVGLWFPPDSHIDVGSCNCPLSPHLPHSQLSPYPGEGGEEGV